jgi:hypothetical protein
MYGVFLSRNVVGQGGYGKREDTLITKFSREDDAHEWASEEQVPYGFFFSIREVLSTDVQSIKASRRVA